MLTCSLKSSLIKRMFAKDRARAVPSHTLNSSLLVSCFKTKEGKDRVKATMHYKYTKKLILTKISNFFC